MYIYFLILNVIARTSFCYISVI